MRTDQGLNGGGGASSGVGAQASASRALVLLPPDTLLDRLRTTDWTPDLGSDIGSRTWFRGVATCLALCAGTWMLAPGLFDPLPGVTAPAFAGADFDEIRSQSIAPLALGATTGHRMAATDLVAALPDTPERPIIDLTATLANGDTLRRTLERSGVAPGEAAQVTDLVGRAVALGEITPGTRLDIKLGRRAVRSMPRPLEKLAFRAKFDLAVELARSGDGLGIRRIPIAIDRTPLRIRGRVGTSLYRSARAAGVPARSVAAFIKSISAKVPMTRIGADDEYDIIVEQARAETGEVQLGDLLFAGLSQGSKAVQLVRWEQGGTTRWLDPKGMNERRGSMSLPVAGRLSSGFGSRGHPVLGFRRFHKGLDIAAPTGTPIHAATDGVVAFAGRNGGYGNFVKLSHGGGMQTAYGHMSRIAVRSGTRVSRGQVIGYVGSTGLSTGPHVHYELIKGGRAVDPRSVSLSSVERLTGSDLAAFKSKLARLMAVPSGAGAAREPE
ncbi:peptidoglycan DD-metalloendopeptidase family protein [Sphingomonas japonica]|uniref:peptidoglycan DD-metalloendopeptidase family protein n=1 Tax=Sphingomonas japonica TaxID=511662 RepID=UPI0031E28CC5